MEMHTDSMLLNVEDIKKVYCYPSIVSEGFEVWHTNWWEGPSDRYQDWGPFARLVKLLEGLRVMDNKIVVEYTNGVFVGFFDGSVRIGVEQRHLFENIQQKVIEQKDLLKRYRTLPYRFR